MEEYSPAYIKLINDVCILPIEIIYNVIEQFIMDYDYISIEDMCILRPDVMNEICEHYRILNQQLLQNFQIPHYDCMFVFKLNGNLRKPGLVKYLNDYISQGVNIRRYVDLLSSVSSDHFEPLRSCLLIRSLPNDPNSPILQFIPYAYESADIIEKRRLPNQPFEFPQGEFNMMQLLRRLIYND